MTLLILKQTTNGKIDIAIFIYIIKQKDDLVRELQDKNKMLKEHISLLNSLRTVDESKTVQLSTDKNTAKTLSDDKDHTLDVAQETGCNNINKRQVMFNNSNLQTSKIRKNMPASQSNKVNKQQSQNCAFVISNEEVSTAVLEAQTKQKIGKYININSDMNNEHSNNLQKQEWKTVKNRKRRQSLLIGKNRETSAIKGVPRWVDLHVSRLEPNTTVTSIVDMLKVHIPEVKCESLVPKHPGLYASFKVSVLEDSFKAAMNADIWPYGVCINRFFLQA